MSWWEHGVRSLYLPSGNRAAFWLAFSFLVIQFGYLHRLVLSTFRGIFPPQINLSRNPLQTFSEVCLLGGSNFRQVDTENE